MSIQIRGIARRASLFAAAALFAMPLAVFSQSNSASSERWLHVRVISSEAKGDTVKVNVPLELAEKVLPTINKDRLHNGKVKVDKFDCNGVDLRALLDAVRTTKDGEFVTVQSNDADVNVAKRGEYLLVHVTDKSEKHPRSDKTRARESRVEVKVPMKVVDALLSSGKDELDLLAALRALGTQGDTELVSVKDDENTVRVWLDSKNISD
ncbi:MAG: hypothetical protein C5B56_11580 [Proteobacteria bacterium]|nr:MAG: hypothetical protein C5B56_11580 [Pseudomonadota bacterium]